MKVRTGFVSNSSSSSFVLAKSYMSEEQIKEFSEFYKTLEENEEGDYIEYYVNEDKYYFVGHGESSDEDRFTNKLKSLGVDEKYIGGFGY